MIEPADKILFQGFTWMVEEIELCGLANSPIEGMVRMIRTHELGEAKASMSLRTFNEFVSTGEISILKGGDKMGREMSLIERLGVVGKPQGLKALGVEAVYPNAIKGTVTVKFTDGTVRTEQVKSGDEYDPYVGFCIAYTLHETNKKVGAKFRLKNSIMRIFEKHGVKPVVTKKKKISRLHQR